jgi:methyl-accepting chemotaxis protein
MFAFLQRNRGAAVNESPVDDGAQTRRVVEQFARHVAALGRDAAEVRGVIDDSTRLTTAQVESLKALSAELQQVLQSQATIDLQAGEGLVAVQGARQAVLAVGQDVTTIVDSLQQVSDAAGQITQIALQTRLVAFNASVEAKRAGEAGRGFGVVADAVKDLAARVEASSKQIMGTVQALDGRISQLQRETTAEAKPGESPGRVHVALQQVEAAAGRINNATAQARQQCGQLEAGVDAMQSSMRQVVGALESALGRTETFLKVSEQLIEAVAESGIETEDTPYIRAVQQAAGQVSKLLEDAVRTGTISASDLFDERYQPLAGSNPPQHLARFTDLADRLFPQVQERLLELSDKVVFCIAVDRNGYVPCHNRKYNQPQRPGDTLWNTANCRNRRIFNDRTGLASGRNTRPFLLQTYRRDMGGGQFVVMKEAAAPITVGGRHWGGVRLAFRF